MRTLASHITGTVINPWNDDVLVKIKAKDFVYDALDLKELATQLNTLADVMGKRYE